MYIFTDYTPEFTDSAYQLSDSSEEEDSTGADVEALHEYKYQLAELLLIQSFDDLSAAQSLIDNEHYCQSVFSCTQSLEKCMKSLAKTLMSHNCPTFDDIKCLHDLKRICKFLQPYLSHNEEECKQYKNLLDLCETFENLGCDSSWSLYSNFFPALSIRSRYFQIYGADNFINIIGTFPPLVFDREIALKALSIAKEIYMLCEEHLV